VTGAPICKPEAAASNARLPLSSARWELVATLVALVLYLPAALAYVLWRHVDHNEHMYAAAAVMRGSLATYRDFCWIQAPYWIDLQSLVFRLTGDSQLLLTGRLLNFGLGLTGLLIFHRLARRAAGAWPALVLTAILALSRHFLMPSAEASNYCLAFAAGLGATACLLRALRLRRRGWAFAGGLLLAVASGTKLYYLAAWPVFVGLALLRPRDWTLRQRVRRILLPGAAGLLLGLASFVFQVLRAPASAWFGNLGYHRLNQFAFRADGIPFSDNLRRLAHMAAMPESIALLVFLLLALVLAFRARQADDDGARRLFGGLTLLATLSVLSPRPIYPQYLLFPLPFALLAAAQVLGSSRGGARRWLFGTAVVALGVSLVLTGPPLARGPARFTGDAPTAAARQQAVAVELRALVGDSSGPVATLSPLHALEAGLPIAPELVTGPFVHRIADRLEPAERRRLVIVAPGEIASWLEALRPAAVLVGEEGGLDAPLQAFAEEAGYGRHELPGGRLAVWLRPEPR
jgi:hypothetical protein